MKIIFNDYNYLLDNLSKVQVVSDDAMSEGKFKTIIFKINNETNSLQLVGINQYITYRCDYDKEKFNLELTDEDNSKFTNNVFQFAITSKSLVDFLNTYKALNITEVDSVVFELRDGKNIICTVYEKSIENESSENVEDDDFLVFEDEDNEEDKTENNVIKNFSSKYAFENIPIKSASLQYSGMEVSDEDLEMIPNVVFNNYIKTMLPLMANDTTLHGMLTFDDKRVAIFNSAYNVFQYNLLKDSNIFNCIRLLQKNVNFINKIVINSDDEGSFGVKKIENTDRLYLKWNNCEAFIHYDMKIPVYKNLLEAFSTEHYVTINRLYLRDVLKRLMLDNDSITVNIVAEENKVEVFNSKFKQEIPILHQKDMENIKIVFKVMPNVLNSSIIGDDKEMKEEIMICYTEKGNNKYINFCDESEAWNSIVRIRVI